MSEFEWNIALIFIRVAWLIKGNKPRTMATWWNIGRLYWCIHPRFRINYVTKKWLGTEYVRIRELLHTRNDNFHNRYGTSANVVTFKKLWEALDMIYKYVDKLGTGIKPKSAYEEADPLKYAGNVITAIAEAKYEELDKRLNGWVDVCEMRDDFIEAIHFPRGVGKVRNSARHLIAKLLNEINERNKNLEEYAKELLKKKGQISRIKDKLQGVYSLGDLKVIFEEIEEEIAQDFEAVDEATEALRKAGKSGGGRLTIEDAGERQKDAGDALRNNLRYKTETTMGTAVERTVKEIIEDTGIEDVGIEGEVGKRLFVEGLDPATLKELKSISVTDTEGNILYFNHFIYGDKVSK